MRYIYVSSFILGITEASRIDLVARDLGSMHEVLGSNFIASIVH